MNTTIVYYKVVLIVTLLASIAMIVCMVWMYFDKGWRKRLKLKEMIVRLFLGIIGVALIVFYVFDTYSFYSGSFFSSALYEDSEVGDLVRQAMKYHSYGFTVISSGMLVGIVTLIRFRRKPVREVNG